MHKLLQQRLDALRNAGLYRQLRCMPGSAGAFIAEGRRILNFSSNDYLDLSGHPDVKAAARRAIDAYGAGATASRLMSGHLPLHAELEAELADWCGYESALLFGSGFLANAGIVPALARGGDRIFADKLAHASVIEGLRLSEASFKRFRHNDAAHLDRLLSEDRDPRGLRLVITESVFSMDGDLAPLADLGAVCRRHNALFMVDEAHAIGVFGPSGAGLCRSLPDALRPDLVIGTLGKALGSHGGFCACSSDLRDYLINTARTFIFSTALPPASAGAALQALRLCRSGAPGRDLLNRAARFREALRAAGIPVPDEAASQIIPVPVGDNHRAVALADRLRERDLLVTAIRPPTVPPGTARLRLSVTLAHSDADLDRAAESMSLSYREGLA